MKRKGLFITLALACCLTVGNAPGMATSVYAKGENVVTAEKAETDGIFEIAHSVAAFSIDSASSCSAVMLSDNGFDFDKAVEAVESGSIAPLSLGNLPQGVNVNQQLDFVGTDGNSQEIVLDEVATVANCAHVYQAGTFTAHKKNTDGSCDTVAYDALKCDKCKTIWLLDQVGSTYFRVCPHKCDGQTTCQEERVDETISP